MRGVRGWICNVRLGVNRGKNNMPFSLPHSPSSHHIPIATPALLSPSAPGAVARDAPSPLPTPPCPAGTDPYEKCHLLLWYGGDFLPQQAAFCSTPHLRWLLNSDLDPTHSHGSTALTPGVGVTASVSGWRTLYTVHGVTHPGTTTNDIYVYIHVTNNTQLN